jgi:hypothetical protein
MQLIFAKINSFSFTYDERFIYVSKRFEVQTKPIGSVPVFGSKPNRTECQETKSLKFRFDSVLVGLKPIETDKKNTLKTLRSIEYIYIYILTTHLEITLYVVLLLFGFKPTKTETESNRTGEKPNQCRFEIGVAKTEPNRTVSRRRFISKDI